MFQDPFSVLAVLEDINIREKTVSKERRKNSAWQISNDRDVHSAIEACSSFFHGNGTEL